MVLQVDNLRSGPCEPPCLLDITLSVQRGEVLWIGGVVGAGKSTLLRTLAGLLCSHGGTITWDGVTWTGGSGPPVWERPVGMAFQSGALWPHLTVRQHLAYALEAARDLDQPARASRLAMTLAAVGLGGHGHRYPAELSGGQQQQLNLARAFVRRRPLLLLDEPFASLDRGSIGRLLDVLIDMHRQRHTAILLVSHGGADIPSDWRRGVIEGGRWIE